MKKTFIIICSIVITLVSNPIFAQADPGDDPEAPGAPIDDYVWVLALMGILFVFLTFRAIQNNKIKNLNKV